MGVRRTEGRLPAGLSPGDLGQAEVSADGRCTLIAFVTTPIVVNRTNVYVVFVTDQALASSAESYEWSFSLDGGTPEVHTTTYGETEHSPTASGSLQVRVRIRDGSNQEQAALQLTQDVVSTNATLETLIEAARNEQGPTVAHPEVARELINEHNLYYQNVALSSPEAGEGFKTFLFTMVHDGALEHAPAERTRRMDGLAAALNDGANDFAGQATGSFGVCAIRLGLLAMTSPSSGGATPALAWTEMAAAGPAQATEEAALRQSVAALDLDTRVDLFNRARFPKSNINQCGRILEALRDRYFAGKPFDDVLTGQDGIGAHWIVRHYREGPLRRS